VRAPEIDALARAHIVSAQVAPAAALGVACRTAQGWRVLIGAAGVRSRSHPEPVDPETPFDLASVTKPFLAATIARLVKRGILTWETPLGAVLPELSHTPSGPVPLLLFLSHRAGLEAHRGLFLPLVTGKAVDERAAVETAACARRPDCVGPAPPPGFPPVYSDLGYLLAGLAAARAEGSDLADVVAREVTGPLDLDVACAATFRAHRQDFDTRVAPTELVPWRGGEVVGSVHDENAWALSGSGLAGHAGLFGTVASVARFGAAMLDAVAGKRPDWLLPHEAGTLVCERPGGTLRAGFDGRSPEGSSAGTAFGPRAFGHLGFTGTSLWCDPDTHIVTVILTNRVNPSRDNVAIRAARPGLNDALYRIAADLAAQGSR